MSSYFAYNASVRTPTGSYHSSGTYRATGQVSETDMKAAVARGIANEQCCDPGQVTVLDFAYSQIT